MSNVTERYAKAFNKYVSIEAARTMQTNYNNEVERIRNNHDLTDSGKRTAIARTYRDTRHSLDAMRRDLHNKMEADRLNLTRQVFGNPDPTPQGLIAHRDARARAAQLTDRNEATDALAMAHLDNDVSLARAITHHAHTQGWKTGLM